MRFEILGPIRVRAEHAEVPTTANRERILLAMLVLHNGEEVSRDRLVRAIWGDHTPRKSRSQLHGCVSRLRRRLADAGGAGEVIITEPSGYRLRTGPHSIDLAEFRALVAEARSAATHGQRDRARERYRAALDMWRGPALAGVASPVVRQAAAGLDEERVRAQEECLGVELALGAGGELIAELTDLVHQHPLREGLHHALMLTLFRAGRQADALAAYQQVRKLLVTELGQEPGPALRKLHQRVLAGDSALLPPNSAAVGDSEPQAAPSHCLPRAIDDFTGRAADLAWLLDAAEHADPYAPLVLAIDGMPGVGKTSLGVRAAHLLAARYPDGQLFIDLHGHSQQSPVEPATALTALLRQLGLPASYIPTELDERVERWRGELANRRILVVLDNAAGTTQITSLLPAAAGSLAIVTSRRHLLDLDSARPLSMTTLDADDAVALLARIAGNRVTDDPDAAGEVAKRCGYLPLALRMAAARLAHRPHWRVRDLADRLGDHHQPLAGLAAGDHTIADAFALSYEHLAATTQRFFRLLGLHPGEHFDAHAAAALTGTTLPDARHLAEELVDNHLAEEIHVDRYRLHDLVKTYAAQLTQARDTDRDRTAAVEGLLDYYLHAAAAAGEHLEGPVSRWNFHPGEPLRPELSQEHTAMGMAWLEAERSNLTAAIACARAYGHDRHTWLIARATWQFFYQRGYLDELVETHHHGLAAAERLDDPHAVATTRNYLASAYFRTGRCNDAAEHVRHIISIYRKARNLAAEAIATKNLAIVNSRVGRRAETVRLYEQARVLAERSGDPHVLTSVVTNIGAINLELGSLGAALKYSRRALALAREVGDQSLVDFALGNIGAARGRLGQHKPAIRLLTAALRLKRRTGNRYGEAEILNEIGAVYRALGRLDEALEHHREALTVMRQSGDLQGEYAVWNELGRTLRETGDIDGALELHQQALTGTTKIGHKYGQARALDGIATCLRDTDPAAARRHWLRALQLYQELDVPERDEVHGHLAALHA